MGASGYSKGFPLQRYDQDAPRIVIGGAHEL
jgi:hypothetical protein